MVCFGVKPDDNGNNSCGGKPPGNGTAIWIDSVEFNSDYTQLTMTVISHTVAKFKDPDKLNIMNIKINEEAIVNDEIKADYFSEFLEKHNSVYTTWKGIVDIPAEYITNIKKIQAKLQIPTADGNYNALKNSELCFGKFSEVNGTLKPVIYEMMSSDEGDWKNSTTDRDGEKIKIERDPDEFIYFTKGGSGSFETSPKIFIVGEVGINIGKIKSLRIKKNNDNEIIIPIDAGEGSTIYKPIDGFLSNEINLFEMTPISVDGLSGTTMSLNFLVDTQINDSKLGDGIIGELDSEGKIKINLSEIKELSGIKGYSYTLKVGDKTETKGEGFDPDPLVTPTIISSTTLTMGSVNKIVVIPTSGFIPGSKATLLFTVYDKLGHEKTFEKTYFIPAKSLGTKATIEDESKQRKSKLKIIGEGTKDKFGLESSIDGSSE